MTRKPDMGIGWYWWAFRFVLVMVWRTHCPVWMARAELDGWRSEHWPDYSPGEAVTTSTDYWEMP